MGRCQPPVLRVVQERYAAALADWEAALDEPLARSGPFTSSRLPDGLDEPERTTARLDAWAAAHVGGGSFRRQHAEENGAGIVSAGLDAHSAITRWNTALRYREHLQAREAAGETITGDEWAVAEQLHATARDAAEAERADTGPHPPAAVAARLRETETE